MSRPVLNTRSATPIPIKLPLALTLFQGFDFPHKLGICERLFGRALAKEGICWVNTAAGLVWKLDLLNSTLRWIVYGKYEGAAFLNWAKDFLPRNGMVVDSGANIGQMLLYLAQYVPEGKVLAFEPGDHQADWLAECLAVHSHLSVQLFRLALGNEEQTAFLRNTGPKHSHGSWNQVANAGEHEIHVVRLSRILNEAKIPHVDLWKLDVEGHEVPALQGADEWLKAKRIRALWIEMAGENGARIRQHLESLGYRAFLFDRKGRLTRSIELPNHCNALFLPESP
jgi:FkbM family methyltransferase